MLEEEGVGVKRDRDEQCLLLSYMRSTHIPLPPPLLPHSLTPFLSPSFPPSVCYPSPYHYFLFTFLTSSPPRILHSPANPDPAFRSSLSFPSSFLLFFFSFLQGRGDMPDAPSGGASGGERVIGLFVLFLFLSLFFFFFPPRSRDAEARTISAWARATPAYHFPPFPFFLSGGERKSSEGGG